MHLHNLRDEYPEHNSSLNSLERDVDRLAHLVEQMLLLHRTTPDHYPAKFESLSLAALASTVWVVGCPTGRNKRAERPIIGAKEQSLQHGNFMSKV